MVLRFRSSATEDLSLYLSVGTCLCLDLGVPSLPRPLSNPPRTPVVLQVVLNGSHPQVPPMGSRLRPCTPCVSVRVPVSTYCQCVFVSVCVYVRTCPEGPVCV